MGKVLAALHSVAHNITDFEATSVATCMQNTSSTNFNLSLDVN